LLFEIVRCSLRKVMTDRAGKNRKPVVLLADDEAVVRRLLQRILKNAGYEVIAAETGEQAVEYARAVHPDLVLLDVMMPGMGGVKALQEITAHPPTPIIIMLTGVLDLQVAEVAKNLGAHDYLTKPIDVATLQKALQTHLFFDR